MEDGYVAFDLDGTIARLDEWHGFGFIGEPIKPMIDLIKHLLAHDVEVRILTARAASSVSKEDKALFDKAIDEWMLKNIGVILTVTSEKDFRMLYLYDDRCVTVEKNTGKILAPLQFMIIDKMRCGCKETCFERGGQWGHLESVLCKHLTEVDLDGKPKGWCSKYGARVFGLYTNEKEYDEVRNEK